nr:zinc-binding dehydrogenase [Lysinibacter cavernae]
MRVTQFGHPPTPVREPMPKRNDRNALIRVTHASIGVTDTGAAQGDYLLQPVRGFVPGYDFVGVIEQLPSVTQSQLRVGQRIAGVLPRMGAHASVISVAPSLLVPVPDSLDSATAATVPLDAVTAWFALDALALTRGTVLVQGAGGAVGSWAAQLATEQGLTVYGTASSRSRAYAGQFTTSLVDYHDPNWITQIIEATNGGVDGAIDHTGSSSIRRAVRQTGGVVRTAFGGAPGHQRSATASGFLTSALLRYARPRERICSVPIIVATRRAEYRDALTKLFAAVSRGELVPPRPRIVSPTDYAQAFAANIANPGEKMVLER